MPKCGLTLQKCKKLRKCTFSTLPFVKLARPEGHVIPCLNPFSAQTISMSLSHCIFTKVAEAVLALLREMGMHVLKYLDDWLILSQSQRPGLSAPSLIETLGQLGEERALPCAEHLFSPCGVGLSLYDSMFLRGVCSVGAVLFEKKIGRDDWAEIQSEVISCLEKRVDAHISTVAL